MARSIDYKFYNRKQWKQVRDAYFKSVFGLCERCGKPGYIVHHKTPLNTNNVNDPKIAYSFDNLELLCLDCHNAEHFAGRPKVREGLVFDENGNLVKVGDNG